MDDCIELISAHGRARVSRQGAQVMEAEIGGQPLLWLSPLASIEAGKPVRGGVPVCFPWFGKHPDGLPAHGFARNQDWVVQAQQADRVVLSLQDSPEGRALWPHAFRLELAISLDERLQFDLSVENLDTQPFSFSYALHSYFAVTDSRQCTVEGLSGRLRREVGHVTTPHHGTVLLDQPIDAVFETAAGTLQLLDGQREIVVGGEGMRSAVVWNPGMHAEGIADIGPHWTEYVCLERGNIGVAAVMLAPAGRHVASMWLESRLRQPG
ncbi:D-hexose-6-phosphate mutarotase [Chitinimonas viridis]|uniref:Putative glucose-6-phosphate 1-epimerase n=1 Tax=Chitinimonas viridis TaxID=664880 RepID=A0ABT8B2K9_9NEIS|nr:D-hexose-6-phosphate mutarotase [Chitinimonas viridis]MDN3576363.1 D-hexose-6-phosphate mutarotase [Chitinimonas viridis]